VLSEPQVVESPVLSAMLTQRIARAIARLCPQQGPGPAIENHPGLFRMPAQFREVTLLRVQHHHVCISARYATLRAKIQQRAWFWTFIDEACPPLRSSADIRPVHARAFSPYREAHAKADTRRNLTNGCDCRMTVNHDVATIRTFFTEIARWSRKGHAGM
jgi:hypothetical protein